VIAVLASRWPSSSWIVTFFFRALLGPRARSVKQMPAGGVETKRLEARLRDFPPSRPRGSEGLHASRAAWRTAVNLAASVEPDLITLDVVLPGIRGVDVCG
jgi:CheY-like chemotaxis protein